MSKRSLSINRSIGFKMSIPFVGRLYAKLSITKLCKPTIIIAQLASPQWRLLSSITKQSTGFNLSGKRLISFTPNFSRWGWISRSVWGSSGFLFNLVAKMLGQPERSCGYFYPLPRRRFTYVLWCEKKIICMRWQKVFPPVSGVDMPMFRDSLGFRSHCARECKHCSSSQKSAHYIYP